MKALPEGEAILGAMNPNVADLLKSISRNGWLPMEVDLEIMRAAASIVGVDKMRALGLESTRRSAETPLLKPIVRRVTTTLFRVNIHGVVRIIKRTVPSLYRNIGSFSPLNEGETKTTLIWRDAPSFLLLESSRSWLEGLSGGFEMAFRVCQVEGTLTRIFPTPPCQKPGYLNWLKKCESSRCAGV
ncbi:MAG: hypothetical protein GY822_12685 [Deltaproteobacteria bacterium]|nr:hypothetical protein [Deltaproteobacteria bacterium]